MPRTTIVACLAAALALSLAAATQPALADPAVTTLAPIVASTSATHLPRGARAERFQRALQVASDPALAAIRQMRMIERIHLRQSHPERAIAMYREVLGRTQNTMLRNVVNARLARLAAWQPRDLDAALGELQRGLEENLSKVQ